MEDFKKKYYNQDWLWARDFSLLPGEKERVEETKTEIALDVKSVLDVGCGNGFFLKELQKEKKYGKLVGLDQSKEALKYVKTDKVLGSITNLPFSDRSFDLITCSEVLEHLPQEDFKKGISELQRVSKKYILITVPNDEDLEHSLVMCPKCHCWFNPYFHVRSFDKSSLQDLFEKFNSIKIKEIGPIKKYRSYNRLLLTFYRSWKKPLLPTGAVCPQCGYQHKGEEKNGDHKKRNRSIFQEIFFPLIESLSKLIWYPKKKRRWLLALYKKRDDR